MFNAPTTPTPAPQRHTNLERAVMRLHRGHKIMVDSLDKRVKRQRALVTSLLEKYDWTAEELSMLSAEEAKVLNDETLLLCYHILRDLEYLDSLR